MELRECNIELLQDGGNYVARIEGLTASFLTLRSNSLAELLEQLSIELEDKLG